MKPPARKSCQSTRRTLDDARRNDATEDVELHLVADLDARTKPKVAVRIAVGEPFLDRHLRLALERPVTPPFPLDDLFVPLEPRPIGDGVLPRQPSTAHRLVTIQIHVLATDGHDARAQRRNDLGGATRSAGLVQEGRHLIALALLDVDEEHVGRFGPGLDGEVPEQVDLQRPDAQDEKGAEADGQQNDPRLIAGPRDAQHRLPQRERPRVPQRLNRTHEHSTRQVQHERRRHEASRQHQAYFDRACLPRRHGHERHRHTGSHRPFQPIDSGWRRRVMPQQQRGLDVPHVEQWNQ